MGEETFCKYCGKGENAGNQHFLVLSPTMFSPLSKIICFSLKMSSANMDVSKILSFGKEFNCRLQ